MRWKNRARIIRITCCPTEKQGKIYDCPPASTLKNSISFLRLFALWGTGHLAIYSAAKAAINSLTESLNMELEQYGIFVGDIRVPYVNTPMLEQDVLAASIEKLGISLDPQHVAELVWKSANKNKIHRGKGMLPFYILLRFPSSFIRWILKKLILPSKGKK